MDDENPMHDVDELEVPTILIENHRFVPDRLTVEEGAVIKIMNSDPDEHSVTAESGEFDEEIKPTHEVELFPPPPGTYPFYCRYHPEMRGVLVVKGE
jgi:plastocyanin